MRMPLRLPPALPDSPDTSRRWLWLALLTGVLALLLAGWALVPGGVVPDRATGAGPVGYGPQPAGDDAATAAHRPLFAPYQHLLTYTSHALLA